jgi:hypothetical protein
MENICPRCGEQVGRSQRFCEYAAMNLSIEPESVHRLTLVR